MTCLLITDSLFCAIMSTALMSGPDELLSPTAQNSMDCIQPAEDGYLAMCVIVRPSCNPATEERRSSVVGNEGVEPCSMRHSVPKDGRAAVSRIVSGKKG